MDSSVKYTLEEVLAKLRKDQGAAIFPEDSSSDEDLVEEEYISDTDSFPSSESDSEEEVSSPADSVTPTSSPRKKQPKSFFEDEWYVPLEFPPKKTPKKRKAPVATLPTAKEKRHYSGTAASPGQEWSKASQEEVEEEKWNYPDVADIQPAAVKFTPARVPGPTIDINASWSPFELFKLFFSTTVVRTIIDNTNANARRRWPAGRKFKWVPLTVCEFWVFMAIIIFTGLIAVKDRSDYWKKDWPYNFEFPRKNMTRDRFESILWSLHLSDPAEDEENDKKKHTPSYDRLHKIKPLYTEIVDACQSYFHPYQNICIDERMVTSKARISMKQHMKDKPTKWGYKLFVCADSKTAYTWNFCVYQGEKELHPDTEHGLSYTSVMDLLPFGRLGGGYHLYVDNFYSSTELFLDLYEKNFRCCGTIQQNWKDFPKSPLNDLPKRVEKGDMRWIRRDKLLFVKWMDSKPVALCSTLHQAFSGKTIHRRVKENGEWAYSDVPVPDAVVEYNLNMGGVDLSDASIGYYSVHHKTMKWYKTFFYHFIDIAVVNSFVLQKQLWEIRKDPSIKKLTQKTYREKLAKEMLDFGLSTIPPQPPSSTTHLPMFYSDTNATAKRRYCKRCTVAGKPKVKTPAYCSKCQVPLCLKPDRNCFFVWHMKGNRSRDTGGWNSD